MMKSKKSQAWGFDIMIAVMIFSIGLILFYLYSTNSSSDTEQILDSLNYDGNNIADGLLSSGFPADWTVASVVRIGIADGNKINETKLQGFYDLVALNYNRTKVMFNVNSEYYISLSENMTISNQSVQFFGNYNSNPDNLIRVTRIINYNERPVTLYVYVWK